MLVNTVGQSGEAKMPSPAIPTWRALKVRLMMMTAFCVMDCER